MRMRYESRRTRPVRGRRFALRLAGHASVATGFVAVSLLAGMIGYREFEHMSWLDAFLNASMLLGGMGPVQPPVTPIGKLFAGAYALYSGLVFLITAGVVFAPVVHRVMHELQWEDDT